MMFGSREEFEYSECADCGSLQINEVPTDISKYYSSNYLLRDYKQDGVLKRFLKKHRFIAAWRKKNLFGSFLLHLCGVPAIASFIKQTGIQIHEAILDVGTSDGRLLLELNDVGFTNLTGVDPYIESDLVLKSGLLVLKKKLNEVTENYDLIMFNHSLEHVPNPEEELQNAARLLNKGKFVLVRLPVAGCYAWREYKTNWVQLDAPRHLNIPSVKGMKLLAERIGYIVDGVIFESTDFQFWGSEQYKRDIPLKDDRSLYLHSKHSIFSSEEIQQFKARAAKLNAEEDGDMACFFLRKS